MGTTFWVVRLHSDGRLLVTRCDTPLGRPFEGFKQILFLEDPGDYDRLGPGVLAVMLDRGAGKTLASIERLAAKVARRDAAGLLLSPRLDPKTLEDLPASGDFPIFIKPRDLDWSAVLQPLLNLHPSVESAPNPEAARRRLLFDIIDKHGRVDLSEDRARRVGMDLNEMTRIVVVHPLAELETPFLNRLEELVAAELLDHDLLSTALTYQGLVVGTESARSGWNSVVPGRLLFKARNAMSESVVMVGVGTPHPGAEGIFRSFREARWAARVGLHQAGPNSVISFEDLGTSAWLEPFDFAAGDGSSLAIEQLSAHDALHDTRLLETLIAYLASGRAKDAADHLFIHRNTLRYRLECVRKLTGLDPHEQGSRLVLDLHVRLATAQGLIPTLSAIKREHEAAAAGRHDASA